jgi:CheY-like chemotaxis protein
MDAPGEKTILVVEDNNVAAMAAKVFLIKLGFQVDLADDGDKAVRMVKENHYAGIYMDIGLPTISGKQACIEIREYEAQNNLEPVPIVAVTGNNGPEETKQYLEAGMQHVMDKPFTPEKAAVFVSFCQPA